MRLGLLLTILLAACLTAAGAAIAAMPPTLWSKTDGSAPVSTEVKPVAVIFFTNRVSAHCVMVQHMIQQARSELGLVIREYALDDEKDLAQTVDTIADSGIGLIVIVEPRDSDALMKIPSLYPDIDFSVIDTPAPLYMTNVRSMQFKLPEGSFMMGVLAALHSKTGHVGFISKDDNDLTRNFAYAFLQGAEYADASIKVSKQLGVTPSYGKPLFDPADKSDIEFVLDPELFEDAARDAKAQKRLIIPFDRDLTAAYPGVVLTSLLKHYDLAIYATLRHYRMHDWRPGLQSLGVGDDFIDYVVENSNRDLLPRPMIEKVERSKDLIGQGIIKVVPLSP